jgi:tetratricopeptide (TPR) repeat protein
MLALHAAEHPARPALELGRIGTMLRMGLYAEVVDLSRRALASAPAGEVRQRLRNRCGEALLHQGEIEPALDILGSPSDSTPSDLEALALRARALTQVGRFAEALELCARVRSRLRADDPLRAPVEDAEIVALRELERFDAAESQLEAAIAAGAPGDVGRRGVLRLRLGQIEHLRGQALRAGQLFDLARHDFEACDDAFGAARALAGLGVAQAETGQWTAARESFRSALELCRRLGESLSASNILANLGQLHAVLGQYAPALDQVAQGIALAERAQLAPTVQRIRIIRAGILSALGLDAAAEPDLRAAETAGNERYRAQALLIRAGAALRREAPAGVAAWLDEARPLFERHAIEDERLRLELARARLDALEGRTAAAASAAARVAASAADLRLLDLVVEAEVLHAELLWLRADPEAVGLARRGREAAHRLGLQECIWRAERLLGHMATAAADRRAALAHYEACVRALTEMLTGVEPDTRSRFLSQPAQRRALAELRELARA